MRSCPFCVVGMGVLAAAAVAGGSLFRSSGAEARPLMATESSAAKEPFAVDGVHSSVNFRIKHMNVSYTYGRFNVVTGTFNFDTDKPEASELDITIQADSVDTNSGGRDKHLKSQDFFSVKEFPTITFKGKSFKKAGDKAIEVTGDLTLHGQTKPLTATVELVGTGPGQKGGEVGGVESKFMIKRSDFGMTNMVGPIGDEVVIMVALEGGRK